MTFLKLRLCYPERWIGGFAFLWPFEPTVFQWKGDNEMLHAMKPHGHIKDFHLQWESSERVSV